MEEEAAVKGNVLVDPNLVNVLSVDTQCHILAEHHALL